MHARVVGVIHEVLDRIVAWLRAGVEADRASERGFGLVRRVEDVVARAHAAVVERVQQEQPVTHLVGRRVTLVVRHYVSAGKRAREHDDTVQRGVLGLAIRDVRPTQEQVRKLGDDVQVQRFRATAVEGALGLQFLGSSRGPCAPTRV